MNNREKLNAMTNKELAEQLCYLVELVATALDHDFACSYCPVNELCRRGENGFIKYLETEVD